MGGLLSGKQRPSEIQPEPYRTILHQYEERCDWLRDTHFLKDLEADSVDSDILDEELRSLEANEPNTCRHRSVKLMESGPMQIVFCILVILDASIVVAEILLDLQATRVQSSATERSLALATDFLRAHFADQLCSEYNTEDINKLINNNCNNKNDSTSSDQRLHAIPDVSNTSLASMNDVTSGDQNNEYPVHNDNSRYTSSPRQPPVLVTDRSTVTSQIEIDLATKPEDDRYESIVLSTLTSREEIDRQQFVTGGDDVSPASTTSPVLKSPAKRRRDVVEQNNCCRDDASKYDDDNDGGHQKTLANLVKVGHALHYTSIAILGVFVLQVAIKAISAGYHFIQQKLEIFDAIVILASFGMDVAFLDGITDAQGEHAAALILIFLLWRILRIVNSLMIANKKRQDFRIKLQKRARMKMEKKLENLRDDIDWYEKQCLNLKNLCTLKGASEDEIVNCTPRRVVVTQASTMNGLSSLVSLSFGLSMAKKGSLAATVSSDASILDHLNTSQPIPAASSTSGNRSTP